MADSSTSPAKRKKNLPFKRTISRRTASSSTPPDGSQTQTSSGPRHSNGGGGGGDDDDDDDLGMFRRSRDFFPIALQDQERRLRREAKRRKASAADDEDKQETKPSRFSIDLLSDESGDERKAGPALSGHAPASTGQSTARSTQSTEHVRARSPTPLSGPTDLKTNGEDIKLKGNEHRSSTTSTPRKASRHVISLDDDDDSNDNRRSDSAITSYPAVGDNKEPRPLSGADASTPDSPKAVAESDRNPPATEEPPDEFSKYILEAQEREARARAAQLEKTRTSQATTTTDAGGDSQREQSGGSQATPKPQKITIKVMVSSLLPDTVPMIAQLNLTQPVGIVKDAWILHQKKKGNPIPEHLQRQMFLTWKGNRIYATVACASLGLDLNDRGRLRRVDPYGEEKPGYHREGLHFQAWTEELYHQHLKDKEREQLRLLGQLDDEQGPTGDDDGDIDGDEDGEAAEKPIKIILKAQGLEPLATKVQMNTKAKAISEVFRRLRDVPPDKTIALYFDGENLEDDTTVQDVEIEDMDNLDVHIK